MMIGTILLVIAAILAILSLANVSLRFNALALAILLIAIAMLLPRLGEYI